MDNLRIAVRHLDVAIAELPIDDYATIGVRHWLVNSREMLVKMGKKLANDEVQAKLPD